MNDKKRFEISRKKQPQNYSMHSAHYHSYYELYYLSEGECNIFIKDSIYKITSGSIVFISPNTIHRTSYIADQNERIYIEFTPDYFSNISQHFSDEWLLNNLANHIIILPNEINIQIDEIVSKLIKEKEKQDSCSSLFIKNYLEEILLLMIRTYYNSGYSSPSANVTIADSTMQEAINFICNNYASRITLTDAAEYLHLNSSYLSKKFKNVNGVGFTEYLNRVRINHAEKLLLETNSSITEIALNCGFDNSNYFGDAFRHINHVSPSLFRKLKGNIGNYIPDLTTLK